MKDDFDLTDLLPYLLNRAGSRIADAFSEMLRREHGITLQAWRVLAALGHQDGQRIGELADTTSIEVSTLSRLVTAVQRQGLIERRRSTEVGDARVVRVFLTGEGRKLARRIIPVAEAYEGIALTGFTPEEARLLKRYLVRVFDNMGGLQDAGDDDMRLAS